MSLLDLFISKEKQLLNAAKKGNITKVKQLIDLGVNINTKYTTVTSQDTDAEIQDTSNNMHNSTATTEFICPY